MDKKNKFSKQATGNMRKWGYSNFHTLVLGSMHPTYWGPNILQWYLIWDV